METNRAGASPWAARLPGGFVARNRPLLAIVRLLVLIALLSAAMLVGPSPVTANHHQVQIHQVMAGANGDDSVEFVELRMLLDQNNCQLGGGDFVQGNCQPASASRGSRLLFFNAAGVQTGVFNFPSNTPVGLTGRSILVGTQAFANVATVQPDFIMPANLMSATSGKVC